MANYDSRDVGASSAYSNTAKDLFNKVSQHTGVPVDLLASVSHTESSWQTNARSYVGAQGLMQIMPDTASFIMQNSPTARAAYEKSNNIYDPETNLIFGAEYLKYISSTRNIPMEPANYASLHYLYHDGHGANVNNPTAEARDAGAKTAANAQNIRNGTLQLPEKFDQANYPGSVGTLGGITIINGINVARIDPSLTLADFAKFIQSLAFMDSMKAGFEGDKQQTIHQFIAEFMSRFYHSLTYNPTLKENKVIVVKPETLFIDPPSCNVIYPSMRINNNFTKRHKQEPTRLLLITDPLARLLGDVQSVSSVFQLMTLAILDYDPDDKTKTKQKVRSFLHGVKERPLTDCSEYEKENGIRVVKSTQRDGADVYLFLLAQGAQGTAGTGENKKTGLALNLTKDEFTAAHGVLQKLATYALLRHRYQMRTGAMTTFFNPYIAPGFPIVNIETLNPSSLNVYGHLESVTHQLSDRSMMTTLQYSCIHVEESEQRPGAFPVVEQEYTDNIATTYQKMLGDVVTPVTSPKKVREEVIGTDPTQSVTQSLGEAYAKVWRPITTMKEHLEQICDGATCDDTGAYWVLKGSFFDEKIRETIKPYADAMFVDHRALFESDVR